MNLTRKYHKKARFFKTNTVYKLLKLSFTNVVLTSSVVIKTY